MGFHVTDVQRALKGASYPADRDALVALARRNGASDDLVDALSSTGHVTFSDPPDVMKALGGSFGLD
jgi:hypothetical protein